MTAQDGGDTRKPKRDSERNDEHRESATAEMEGAEHENQHHEPEVVFEDVNALDTVAFHTPWDTKLTAAWDEAARLLEEPRTSQDRLQTPEGKDLMPDLQLTLRQLEERKIVKALKFQIVGPTGGA